MKITNLIRVLLIVLSLVMVLPLFACGNDNTNDTEETTTEAVENNQTTEGKDTDATEGGKDTDATEGGKDTDATEGGKDTDATEGGKDTDATEGGKDTDATEGGKDTDATEGGNDTDATEGGNDTENTENTDTDGENGDATETVTFFSAIETVFGNDATNPANVSIFQATADGNPAPFMGQSSVTVLGAGTPNLPAEGVAPIALDSATGFGGMFGFSGWGVFAGSVPANVSVSYQITDAEGNVLVEWTAVQEVIGAVVGARPDVDAVLPTLGYTGGGNAFSVTCIVNTTAYSADLAGQSVNFNFAYTTAGETETVYIPFVTVAGVVIPAVQ